MTQPTPGAAQQRPQIVPPKPPPNFEKVGVAVATTLNTTWPVVARVGRWTYGDFVAKGYLSYVGSSVRVLTGLVIAVMVTIGYFQTGQLPDTALLSAAVAAYLGGTGMTDAGNRREKDAQAGK